MSHDYHIEGFKKFALLLEQLNSTTKTNDKIKILIAYFNTVSKEDALYTIALFTHKKPKKPITSTQLKNWCKELLCIEDWLFNECYATVGDLSETIALLVNAHHQAKPSTFKENLSEVYNRLITLNEYNDEAKKEYILNTWSQLNKEELFAFNKLFSGSFRVGVSENLVVQALATITQLSTATITHAISGNWQPQNTTWENLFYNISHNHAHPYPFYLAYPLEKQLHELGAIHDWQVEWKWDGIRGQIIKRNDELFIWSRGEELVTEKFPELHFLLTTLPNGTVLDGEIICMKEGKPLPFAILQTRISRKKITKQQLEIAPIHFIAYDLLEKNYTDVREQPLATRRKWLEEIIANCTNNKIIVSAIIHANNWESLINLYYQARSNNAEGFMLKNKNSTYKTGRKVGDWWKWKTAPLTIDAVLIYAQKGSGKRSNLYTDYTFAVKDNNNNLITFTKAYSGLTDAEIKEVDSFVKKNSVEKFGPVRTVKPMLVFEIAFEGIAKSNRHKCGIALRFPRIARWRKDKTPEQINTLTDLHELLNIYNP